MSRPYYAVIFTSTHAGRDNGYEGTAQQMEDLAKQQKGFLGMESAQEDIGITVSYWENIKAISDWKKNAAHSFAQQKRTFRLVYLVQGKNL